MSARLSVPDASSAAPATKRIDRGRGHSYILDGTPADGITTLIGKGVPKPALVAWAANTTAAYAIDNWDELATLGLAERLRRLEKARWELTDAASNRGTDIHNLAVQLAHGQEIDVPEELVGHVDAYLQFTDDWQPDEHLLETVVVNRKHRYMGTLDLVARLADGNLWLLDWKTSGKGVYTDNALQLAAYKHAETYLGADGQEHPMLQVDRCGIVWIRADGYDLYPVDAGPDVFRTFLYAQQVAHWSDRAKEEIIGDAMVAP